MITPLHSSRAALSLICVLALGQGCAPDQRPDEGFVHVEGGRIWYHRVGSGKGTPLLVLHGGPGACSYYLKPLLALAADRPVIIYDQLGCGKSDRPADTTLFTVDRYVRELQTLRDSLGLREVHLLGHSWGAMLAESYMATRPAGVRSLILASPLVTTAQWEHDADSLIKALPDSTRAAIATHEANHTTSAPAYVNAMKAYYALYYNRSPSNDVAERDSGRAAFGEQVYEYMWGPSEFYATGTLKHFDATAILRDITVPTLFIAGEFDEATPSSTRSFSRLVPGSEFVMVPGSGHLTMHDNPAAMLSAVRTFLAKVERRTAPAATTAADEGADARAVRTARAAQNRAIAALDTAAVASYWTEDVEIRRGLGVLVTGREAYKQLFNPDSGAVARGEELIYQREPATVVTSAHWPLAYEEGSWVGHAGSVNGPAQIGGRYAAQWVKRGDRWLIRGEVYVALTCAGVGCASPAAP